jgi:hypothetical protein
MESFRPGWITLRPGVGQGKGLNYVLGGWARVLLLLGLASYTCGSLPAYGTVTTVSVQSPKLSSGKMNRVTSPVHFLVTAESDVDVTGYVIYVDGQNVYQNSSPSVDAWVLLPPTSKHSVYVKVWDSSGYALSTATYSINVTAVAKVIPPATATRITGIDNPAQFTWTVDNNNGVGGQCNDGSIGSFTNGSDPNTQNSPDFDSNGQHFIVTSKCQYDDSLFYWKNPNGSEPASTNFLWDFWFYIPTTTRSNTVQALEFDLFQAVKLSDGVHEFMFGSQCNYATNQWQFWLPYNGGLTWVNSGLSPCQFSSGTWHHATYFLQRVAASGYQEIPGSFGPSSDFNIDLRFGSLTIDGNVTYLGGLSYSTKPNWSPVMGFQHQLDSAATGVTIEEYVDEESLTVW